MAAYAQYGYGYPTAASQFLTSPTALDVTSTTPAPPAATAPPEASSHPHPSASPLSDSAPTPMACPSLSPEHSHERDSGGSAASSSVGGTLTPDASSQICQTPASLGGGPPSAIGSFLPPPHDHAYNPAAAAAAAVAFAAAPPCSAAATAACCDNGRPMISDPVSGQTVCSCQYDTAHFALSSYTRMQSAAVAAVGVGVGVGVYGSTYAAAAAASEMSPYGVDGGPPGAAATGAAGGMSSQGSGGGVAANVPLSPTSSAATAFYSSLSNPYALKDSSRDGDLTTGSPASWSTAGLQPTTGYYTYDPTFGAYGYGASYDLAARRKNATRESTATLKAWLNEHKKNPYPTKGEKIMLAIITKMTLTQVSTWFANARRRLKKENKMTWEPKNRSEDDDDALVSEEEMERERAADTPTTAKEAAASTTEKQRYGGGSGGAILAAGGNASKQPAAAQPTQSGRSSAPMMAASSGGGGTAVLDTVAAAAAAAGPLTIGNGSGGGGGVGVGAPPVKDPLRSVYYPDQTQYYHPQPHHQAHHHPQQQQPPPAPPPTQPHPHHLQPFNHQPYRHQLQPTHASYAVHAGGGGSPYRSAAMYEDHHVLAQGQQHHQGHHPHHHHHSPYADYPLKEELGPPGEQAVEVKPKIWSLADTAAELATPPPPAAKSFLEGRPPPEWLGDYGGMGGPSAAGYQAELVATIAMQSNVRQYGTPPPLPPPLAGPMGAMGPYRGRGPAYGHAGGSGMPLRLERYEDQQAVREERLQEGGSGGSGGGASVELQHERDVSFKRQHCA